MNLAAPFLRVVEHVDRRVLGAIQFVDAITRLPVIVPAHDEAVRVTGAQIVGGAAVPFLKESVRVRQTRSGFLAIMRAPFFDSYGETFLNPADPPEVAGTLLRLTIALADAGPNYLPQNFQFDLPRSLANDIFKPLTVPLFRTPSASVLGGWSVLRVRVTDANGDPLGGVLVRVFPSPRAANATPIGQGMSEWRGALRGEALVAVADLPRFRPGNANHVLVMTQEIHFEAAHDTNFPGRPNEFPNGLSISAGTANGIVTVRSDGAALQKLTAIPLVPLEIRAGQETTIALTMP
jgi:hypothetical protein